MRNVPETYANQDWPRKVAQNLNAQSLQLGKVQTDLATLTNATSSAFAINGGTPETTFNDIVNGGGP